MEADYRICIYELSTSQLFQVWKDTASIRGWLPFPVLCAVEPWSSLCPWRLYECYLFESSYYFASFFVACNVNSRAATKRGAASIRANTVATPIPYLFQPNVPLRHHCLHYIMITVHPSKGTSEATIGMGWVHC